MFTLYTHWTLKGFRLLQSITSLPRLPEVLLPEEWLPSFLSMPSWTHQASTAKTGVCQLFGFRTEGPGLWGDIIGGSTLTGIYRCHWLWIKVECEVINHKSALWTKLCCDALASPLKLDDSVPPSELNYPSDPRSSSPAVLPFPACYQTLPSLHTIEQHRVLLSCYTAVHKLKCCSFHPAVNVSSPKFITSSGTAPRLDHHLV